ncbi:MAG: S-formylglutathione hydrolase [Pseudomonadota bacterium]
MKLLSQNRVFDGQLMRYQHESTSTKTPMNFSIYLPKSSESKPSPVLYWLSGLTCTDENFVQKAGAFKYASELGIALVCPDTSPRGTDLVQEHEHWDFGSGAGFYVDATQEPWSQHYQMKTYVTDELVNLVEANFAVSQQKSIFGHSMGGHGALVLGIQNPESYQSISAFSPICHPIVSPWGQKAFSHYLGGDAETWANYDTTELILSKTVSLPILIDQGEQDEFLEGQLMPEKLIQAAEQKKLSLTYRLHPGYDHSYFFIASFIEDHIRFHARYLLDNQ